MKKVSSEKGFLGLTREQVIKTVKNQAVILPFGFEMDEGSGCCSAPEAVITASKEINLFDERFGCYPYSQMNIITVKEISPSKRPRQVLLQMQQWQEILRQNGQFALILGGEYRLIPAAIAPWLARGNNIAFVHLGAHDSILYDTAMLYPQLTVLGFGLRSVSEPFYQLAQTQKQRLSIYYARQKLNWDWRVIKDYLANKTIYLSVSVDCFDMSLLPTTPCPEPGGLMWDEVLQCVENLTKIAPIIGASICDFAPIDNMPAYDLLVAKFAYRLLATVFLLK